jgi:predicted MFS family arabinose efflux permease
MDAAPRRASPIELIIIAGCLIAMVTFGVRATFGLFTAPVTNEFGWGRETFGFAMALQNLIWGAAQPIAGGLADKFGSARVLIAGAVIYFVGVALMSVADTPAELYLTGGLLCGVGVAAASFAIVMASFSRAVPEEKRSWAFGIATAASSMGQFVFAPLGQGFINAYGWQTALLLLSMFVLLVIPLAWPLRGNSSSTGSSKNETSLPMGQAMSKAFGHTSYLLLIFGFFVCGFHVAFISTHMPPYLVDNGLSPSIAGWSLALVGLFNVVGSFSAGVLGDTRSKRLLLSGLYFSRAVTITIFVLSPVTQTTALVFSAVMGLLWLSTIPLTAGLVAVMFGTRYMGLLWGVVFFSHQVGSFIGVWLGGRLYDSTGSYDAMWWAGVVLGLFAALVHLPIRETKAQAFEAA